jgi:nicotinate-nucleotide--dimethylbenzimidazole phosphoribosyltransferase
MSLASSAVPATPAPSARRLLVLGGVRSGKSQVAEALIAQALETPAPDAPAPGVAATSVRYIATAKGDPADPAWELRLAAHRDRRPTSWTTEEVGSEPGRVAGLITSARPDEALLIDDLGGWLTAVIDATGRWDDPTVADEPGSVLARAVSVSHAARIVFVSPEVGLAPVAQTDAGRTFTDTQGTLNQRIADVCDAVALVVAGRPIWLSGGAAAQSTPLTPTPGLTPLPAAVATVSLPAVAPAEPMATEPVATGLTVTAIRPAETATGPATTDATVTTTDATVAAPDDAAADLAMQRLTRLDAPGQGLGALTAVVRFAAATQGRQTPWPWRRPRLILLHGDHAGGVAAGEGSEESARRLADATAGRGPLGLLAAQAGIPVVAVECPETDAIEDGDALAATTVDSAIDTGERLADTAADEGADLIVLAACGSGDSTAAIAVGVLLNGGELVEMLPRAVRADGTVDDESWMHRCVAVRDALQRVRSSPRDTRAVLAALGGGDLAVATGLLLCAARRRTPVLVDGPVGITAALLARHLAVEVPRWVFLADHGGHPMVRSLAEVLELQPLTDLRLGLGEGCAALATLPLLRTAVAVAASVAG